MGVRLGVLMSAVSSSLCACPQPCNVCLLPLDGARVSARALARGCYCGCRTVGSQQQRQETTKERLVEGRNGAGGVEHACEVRHRWWATGGPSASLPTAGIIAVHEPGRVLVRLPVGSAELAS